MKFFLLLPALSIKKAFVKMKMKAPLKSKGITQMTPKF